MANDVWRDLAAKLRSVARSEARQVSEPPRRYRATDNDPVTLVALHDPGDVLEEGDEDFDVADGLAIAKGDIVLVHADRDGDDIAFAVVK